MCVCACFERLTIHKVCLCRFACVECILFRVRLRVYVYVLSSYTLHSLSLSHSASRYFPLPTWRGSFSFMQTWNYFVFQFINSLLAGVLLANFGVGFLFLFGYVFFYAIDNLFSFGKKTISISKGAQREKNFIIIYIKNQICILICFTFEKL